ncbi:MAG: SDR family oxidoreductase [Oligoflexia bacterium]|nr:SDR family oxidoreductase [Oligoflexia bacterium]
MNLLKKHDIVVITGASAGVGRATAIAFAKKGARLALLARGIEGLKGAQRDVEKNGGEAIIIPTDVAYADQVEAAVTKVEQELGPIDIWINNAMATVFSEFIDITPDEYKRVTEVVYLGYVNGTRAALKRMCIRNRGSIVQVGSALAYRGIPLQSSYCGAKHAIEGFTESLRSELIHNKINIHISMVQMPALNTPQFSWCKSNMPNKPMSVPPIYQPEVAANAIVYAAYHREREVFVGGKATLIIWANNFFPGLGDWYLGKMGYKSQQTNEVDTKDRPYNLWEPVNADFGVHGDFDNKSKTEAVNVTTTMNRIIITVIGLVFVGMIASIITK